jgi:hypothetical protein
MDNNFKLVINSAVALAVGMLVSAGFVAAVSFSLSALSQL